MSAIPSVRQQSRKAPSESREDRLQMLLRDLEGVERLQQMQWRLLREVIREVNKLKDA